MIIRAWMHSALLEDESRIVMNGFRLGSACGFSISENGDCFIMTRVRDEFIITIRIWVPTA